MLKFSILFSLIAVFSAAHHFTTSHDKYYGNQELMNVTELIASNGYPVQNLTVTTIDGYILDLIRIPHGLHESQAQNDNQQDQSDSDESQSSSESSQQHSQENSTQEDRNNSQEGLLRPAVLLMHGLLSSAQDFVLGGPSQGLAYILADHGYDVFLGNSRGSNYGRKHTVLNPERDPAFWRFCWDDIGMKDLPTIIDNVLLLTGQRKLYYVGHMQGSTVFYVMASEKPEYNEKVHAMISLGPVAFMGHSTNAMLKLISEKQHSRGWVIRHLGENEFKPSRELITEGGEHKCAEQNNEKICQNVFFLLNGYNSRHRNTTSMRPVIDRVSSGSSTRQILHFAQLVKSGRFAKYCIENQQNEDYNLSRITTPMAMFYTPHDALSTMVDVEKLSNKLTHLKQSFRVEELTNNMDLLYGNNVRDIIYRMLLKVLRNIDNNPHNNL